MSNTQHYMNLSYDLAGSRAKNRFRNELFWGIKKMLELYKKGLEFIMVFDYVCDIEVHLPENYEFYQIKTQKDHGTYTIKKLTDKKKTKTEVGKSVIATLYALKFDSRGMENDDICVAVVSNAPLSDGKKKHVDSECINLKEIDNTAKQKIKQCILDELGISGEVNLENTFFIQTGMDLIDPEKALIGEIAVFFEEVFNQEVKRVLSLYRVLASEVSEKACYELGIATYEEVQEKKGISRAKLASILQRYTNNTDTATEKVKEYIKEKYKYDFSERISLITTLSEVIKTLMISTEMKKIEINIVQYIKDNINQLNGTDEQIVEQIFESIGREHSIEINNKEIKILILLVLKKYEEGIYE